MNRRIEYIDQAKGLAMFLVVMDHLYYFSIIHQEVSEPPFVRGCCPTFTDAIVRVYERNGNQHQEQNSKGNISGPDRTF